MKDSLQVLLSEANSMKMKFELLNDRCENLMDYTTYDPVRNNTVTLQTNYTNMLTNLQVAVYIVLFASNFLVGMEVFPLRVSTL